MEYVRGASPKGRMALARRNPVIERGGAAFPEGKTAPARGKIGCPWVPDIDIARVARGWPVVIGGCGFFS